MNATIPETMRAAALDHFGGPEVLHLLSLPVPQPAAHEVLIRLKAAGIGAWDPDVRKGELDLGRSGFPRVIGNDGAGTVVAVGERVRHFQPGDRVYAFATGGGFYAEYACVDESEAAHIPPGLKPEEAGALGADGVTALIGLADELELGPGQKLMIIGASGGVGHIAVQLAKRLGAEVLAIASGEDGVRFVRRLAADAAADGHRDDIALAAREFAPRGLDAALVLAHTDGLQKALAVVKSGGRIAYPHGVEPAPHGRSGVRTRGYDGEPSPQVFERLNRLIAAGPFHVELDHLYLLDEASLAHRDIGKHHLGKLAFRI